MDIEKIIINFVKSKNKKKNIAGLRGLVKTGEDEWSFRYTYQDGDYLSVSKLFKIKLQGIKKTPTFIIQKKKTKKTKSESLIK